jgi:hypothetical protein
MKTSFERVLKMKKQENGRKLVFVWSVMKSTIRRLIIWILLTFNIVVLGLDTLLWHIDPLGTRIMVYNWIELSRHAQPHPTGFMYPQGTIDLGFYSVTTIEDGKRLVPDSGNSACTIAFIGDSVAWGQGVDDAETFVNQIASRFQAVTVWNTARLGYAIENIEASLSHYEADGYIWFVVNNDTEPFYVQATSTRYPSALEVYITTFVAEYRYARRWHDLTWGAYTTLVQSMLARDDVLSFGFDDDPLAIEAVQWGVIPIDNPHLAVSPADRHPSAQGHLAMADSMLPFIEPFISRVCHDE